MLSAKKFLKKKSNDYIEMTIERSHIVAAVAMHLQAMSAIPKSDDITNIQFGDLFGASIQEYVPIKIYTGGKQT